MAIKITGNTVIDNNENWVGRGYPYSGVNKKSYSYNYTTPSEAIVYSVPSYSGHDVTSLRSGNAFLVTSENGVTGQGYIHLVYANLATHVTATTATAGTSGGGSTLQSIVGLSSGNAIYHYNSGSNGELRGVTVIGSTITVGGTSALGAGVPSTIPIGVQLVKVDSSRAFVIWNEYPDSYHFLANVIGTTVYTGPSIKLNPRGTQISYLATSASADKLDQETIVNVGGKDTADPSSFYFNFFKINQTTSNLVISANSTSVANIFSSNSNINFTSNAFTLGVNSVKRIDSSSILITFSHFRASPFELLGNYVVAAKFGSNVQSNTYSVTVGTPVEIPVGAEPAQNAQAIIIRDSYLNPGTNHRFIVTGLRNSNVHYCTLTVNSNDINDIYVGSPVLLKSNLPAQAIPVEDDNRAYNSIVTSFYPVGGVNIKYIANASPQFFRQIINLTSSDARLQILNPLFSDTYVVNLPNVTGDSTIINGADRFHFINRGQGHVVINGFNSTSQSFLAGGESSTAYVEDKSTNKWAFAEDRHSVPRLVIGEQTTFPKASISDVLLALKVLDRETAVVAYRLLGGPTTIRVLKIIGGQVSSLGANVVVPGNIINASRCSIVPMSQDSMMINYANGTVMATVVARVSNTTITVGTANIFNYGDITSNVRAQFVSLIPGTPLNAHPSNAYSLAALVYESSNSKANVVVVTADSNDTIFYGPTQRWVTDVNVSQPSVSSQDTKTNNQTAASSLDKLLLMSVNNNGNSNVIAVATATYDIVSGEFSFSQPLDLPRCSTASSSRSSLIAGLSNPEYRLDINAGLNYAARPVIVLRNQTTSQPEIHTYNGTFRTTGSFPQFATYTSNVSLGYPISAIVPNERNIVVLPNDLVVFPVDIVGATEEQEHPIQMVRITGNQIDNLDYTFMDSFGQPTSSHFIEPLDSTTLLTAYSTEQGTFTNWIFRVVGVTV